MNIFLDSDYIHDVADAFIVALVNHANEREKSFLILTFEQREKMLLFMEANYLAVKRLKTSNESKCITGSNYSSKGAHFEVLQFFACRVESAVSTKLYASIDLGHIRTGQI